MLYTTKKKLAVITGASSGLGKCFAESYASRGYSVVLIARRKTLLDDLALNLKKKYGSDVHVFTSDLASSVQRKKLIQNLQQQFKAIDIFINNAGFGIFGEALKVGIENSTQMIELHSSAVTELTLALLPQVQKSEDRGIIHVSSVAAFHPSVYAAVYAATKAYIYSFSMALASEYEDRINILTLCPGITDTDFWPTSGVTPPKMLFHSPEKVVLLAIEALGKKKLVVVGLENKLRILVQKIFTDEFVLYITKKISILLKWNTKK
ncbi:MAG: SDR family NAD(P)-dependent oxidoreductase [Patescibacteria group bacterium]